MKNLKREIIIGNNKYEKINNENTRLKKENDKSKSELDKVFNISEERKEEISLLKERNSELENSVKEKESDITNLKDTIAIKEKEIDEKNKDISLINVEMLDKKVELDQALKETKNITKEFEDFKTNHKEKIKELTDGFKENKDNFLMQMGLKNEEIALFTEFFELITSDLAPYFDNILTNISIYNKLLAGIPEDIISEFVKKGIVERTILKYIENNEVDYKLTEKGNKFLDKYRVIKSNFSLKELL